MLNFAKFHNFIITTNSVEKDRSLFKINIYSRYTLAQPGECKQLY